MQRLLIFKYEDLETKEQAFVAAYNEERARDLLTDHTQRPIAMTRSANASDFPGLLKEVELQESRSFAYARVLINHIRPF